MRKSVLALTLTSGLAWGASAQQLETIYESLHRPMTYQECVERSVFFDSNVGRQKVDSAQRRLAYDTARSLYLPKVQASIKEDWEYGRSQDNTGAFGPRSSANTTFDLSASYELFSGLRRPRMVKAARLDEQNSDAMLATLRERAELRVMGFFYKYLLEQNIIKAIQQHLSGLEELQERAMLLVKEGKYPSSRLDELATLIETERGFLYEAESQCAMTRVDLSVCVEYYGEAPIQLVAPDLPVLVRNARAELLPPEAIYRHALAHRPDLKAADLGIVAAEEKIRSARSGYIPSLSINAGYGNGYFRVLQQANKSFGDQLRENGRFYVGFSISLPIFDALNTAHAVRRAKIDLHSAQLDKIDADLGLYKDIFKAHANAVAAERKISSTTLAVGAAERASQFARKQFIEGKASAYELEQAEERWILAQREALAAQYDFVYKAGVLALYGR